MSVFLICLCLAILFVFSYTNCTPEDKAPCVAEDPGAGYTCLCDQEYNNG